jgi:nucleoside-diphosphate-sugar epimerase
MRRKIFLTGHTGFIGGAIIKKFQFNNCGKNDFLNKSKEIVLQYSYIDRDNKNNWINLLQDTECIIHCGAITKIKEKNKENPLEIFRKANTEITKILAEEAAKLGVKRFIFLSTIGVNKISKDNKKSVNIKDVPMYTDYYALSKWEAEQELWKVAKQTKLEVVILRPPPVYGFGAKGKFGLLVKLLNLGIPLPFSLFKNEKSYIGIDNLLDIIVRCIDQPEASGKIFSVSDDEDLSLVNLIRTICSVMGRKPRLFPFPLSIFKLLGFVIGKKNEINEIINPAKVDIDDIKKILNWSPPLNVEEGIRRMIKGE